MIKVRMINEVADEIVICESMTIDNGFIKLVNCFMEKNKGKYKEIYWNSSSIKLMLVSDNEQ